MKRRISGRASLAVAMMAVAIVAIAALFTRAAPPREPELAIDPIYAVYRADRHAVHITWAIVNRGESEAKVITKFPEVSRRPVSEDDGTFQCTFSFRDEQTFKDEYRLVPSVYRFEPVVLKPGEVAMVNYYKDLSKDRNVPSWDEEDLQADRIIIRYTVSPFWGDRFDLWHGELVAKPIEFEIRGEAG